MSKTSGRRLFRTPFSLSQSIKTFAVPAQERRNVALGENRELASIETMKSPAVMSGQLPNTDALMGEGTQDSPVLLAHPVQNNARWAANVMPPAPAPQPRPPFQPPPSFYMQAPYPPAVPPHVPPARKAKWAALSKRKKIQMAVVAVLLLLPSLLVIFELINGLILYKQAQDGMSHLQMVEQVFKGASSSNAVATYFDVKKLQQAQEEIDAAHADFVSLSVKLDNNAAISLAVHFLPSQINTARVLGHVGVDGTAIAQRLLKTMRAIAPSIAPALQKSVSAAPEAAPIPYITPSSYQSINTAFNDIAPLIHHMVTETQGLSLAGLPISSSQRAMIMSLLPLLPLFDAVFAQRNALRNPLGWFLGIGAPRAFLIEPMDRAELRATGGFTGQFGALAFNGGHMGQLKLSNIGKYEESHIDEGSPPDPVVYPKVVGQTAPAPYVDWWPVANFGLRDANLSADFPTSAKIAMDRYQYEFGQTVDGVIMFTPALIKNVLQATGPIRIPSYHQTISAQNLEGLLHYYQLDNKGIFQEMMVEHVHDNQVARKLFTQKVTSTLISTVTHLPISKLLLLANEILHAMKSKNLQIYVTNPQLEALIGKYGSTASLGRSTTHDGLFIVQSNLSASKASQYVNTKLQDAITLDKRGGATHHLQLTLDYQKKGDVYGFDTYRDYVRIYVPPNSQLLSGNGFDEYAKPYCGDEQSGYVLCQPDVYGDGSLVCTPPIEMGYATAYLDDPYTNRDHPLDVTGPPPNQQSDEAGRGMFGGWVVIPKDCTMKITVVWYVPPMGKQYNLLLQAQASVYAPLDLTIHPAAGTCVGQQGKGLHFESVMDGEDLSFGVKPQGANCVLVSQ